jgi:hypothetical protein
MCDQSGLLSPNWVPDYNVVSLMPSNQHYFGSPVIQANSTPLLLLPSNQSTNNSPCYRPLSPVYEDQDEDTETLFDSPQSIAPRKLKSQTATRESPVGVATRLLTVFPGSPIYNSASIGDRFYNNSVAWSLAQRVKSTSFKSKTEWDQLDRDVTAFFQQTDLESLLMVLFWSPDRSFQDSYVLTTQVSLACQDPAKLFSKKYRIEVEGKAWEMHPHLHNQFRIPSCISKDVALHILAVDPDRHFEFAAKRLLLADKKGEGYCPGYQIMNGAKIVFSADTTSIWCSLHHRFKNGINQLDRKQQPHQVQIDNFDDLKEFPDCYPTGHVKNENTKRQRQESQRGGQPKKVKMNVSVPDPVIKSARKRKEDDDDDEDYDDGDD